MYIIFFFTYGYFRCKFRHIFDDVETYIIVNMQHLPGECRLILDMPLEYHVLGLHKYCLPLDPHPSIRRPILYISSI